MIIVSTTKCPACPVQSLEDLLHCPTDVANRLTRGYNSNLGMVSRMVSILVVQNWCQEMRLVRGAQLEERGMLCAKISRNAGALHRYFRQLKVTGKGTYRRTALTQAHDQFCRKLDRPKPSTNKRGTAPTHDDQVIRLNRIKCALHKMPHSQSEEPRQRIIRETCNLVHNCSSAEASRYRNCTRP